MTQRMQVADVSPCLYYDDAAAAIEWLCTAFGMKKRLVVLGEGSMVIHSELSLGHSIIMVGSAAKRPGHSSQRRLPAAAHGLSVHVADPDAHYATAKAAGARIVAELHDADYGARGYEAEDLEGHRWYFGNYRPGGYWRPDGLPNVVQHG